MSTQQVEHRLQRTLGIPGAVLLGLGAIIGTGIYVSIGLAAGVAGAAIIPALFLAALIAACNGLSSAQLASVHPVSGGTYEYGHHYLNHWLGFSAGWLFLVAKSASAATAALGFAGYLRAMTGWSEAWQTPVALLLVLSMTAVAYAGLRTSSLTNALLVLVSTAALLAFVGLAAPTAFENRQIFINSFIPSDLNDAAVLLNAAALMFVAFTGYGRVATLGEEVMEPRRTIPRAIIATVSISFLLYVVVAIAAVGAVDPAQLGEASRDGLPLSWAAEALGSPSIARIVSLGALVAMAGVLLNLVLGLSRVVLAMARRNDMPARLSALNAKSTNAPGAVLLVGLVIVFIVLVGDIRTAWSFSAFTVLLYYAITNLAALRVADAERFVPRSVMMLGLIGCLSLAWFVDVATWVTGLVVLAFGLAWHAWRLGVGARS